MSLPTGNAERVCRLALLDPRPIDVPYGTTGARLIGYLIEPDEVYSHRDRDGVGLIAALEALAGITDLRGLREGLLSTGPKI